VVPQPVRKATAKPSRVTSLHAMDREDTSDLVDDVPNQHPDGPLVHHAGHRHRGRPGLGLDDAAGVAQDRPQRARDPATDAVTWAEGELKRVYES
jgi:hypothetical protein